MTMMMMMVMMANASLVWKLYGLTNFHYRCVPPRAFREVPCDFLMSSDGDAPSPLTVPAFARHPPEQTSKLSNFRRTAFVPSGAHEGGGNHHTHVRQRVWVERIPMSHGACAPRAPETFFWLILSAAPPCDRGAAAHPPGTSGF